METGLVSNDLVVFRKGGTRCKITVTGVESHSGNDFTKGRSAIVEMAHKVVEIHQLTDLSVGTTMNIGTMGEWNHTVREYILESSLCQRAKLFAAAVLRLDSFCP